MQDVIGDFRLPELLAVAIEGGGEDGAGVQEVDEDAHAVAGRSGRGKRALAVALLGEASLMDVGLPELAAGLAIEAEDRLRVAIGLGGGHEELVADHDRRTMAATGNLRLPANVLLVAPAHGRRRFGSGDAVARRTAPPRPIVGADRDRFGFGGGGDSGGDDEKGCEEDLAHGNSQVGTARRGSSYSTMRRRRIATDGTKQRRPLWPRGGCTPRCRH